MNEKDRIIETNDFIRAINSENNMDYIVPYSITSIDAEIDSIITELNAIETNTIPWEKGDFIVVFLAGLLGGLADIFIGKPGGYSEMQIKNNSFLGIGKYLKDFDLKNNPIDKTIPGAFGGDHRLFSYGHDLLRFAQGLRVVLNGKGKLGISPLGGELEILTIPENYQPPEQLWQAVLVLLLHLFKDFWTARSLPLPGSTWIAKINNSTMPKLLDELTNEHEINLRQMSGQLISLTIVEIIIRIWLLLKNRDENFSAKQIDSKRSQMLLVGHSMTMLFNAGKIIVTQNPFFLNVPQMMRIIILAWKATRHKNELKQNIIIKDNLSILKSKLMTMKTVLLLNDAIIVTCRTMADFYDNQNEFYQNLKKNNEAAQNSFDEITRYVNGIKMLNE